MTNLQKITRVQVLLNMDPRATTDVVLEYLSLANQDILYELYSVLGKVPTGVTEAPPIYDSIQCELAARYFARRGGLAEIVHVENGIHRHWDTSDDSELIGKIVPYMRIL